MKPYLQGLIKIFHVYRVLYPDEYSQCCSSKPEAVELVWSTEIPKEFLEHDNGPTLPKY